MMCSELKKKNCIAIKYPLRLKVYTYSITYIGDKKIKFKEIKRFVQSKNPNS